MKNGLIVMALLGALVSLNCGDSTPPSQTPSTPAVDVDASAPTTPAAPAETPVK